jgi:hypothetical protein
MNAGALPRTSFAAERGGELSAERGVNAMECLSEGKEAT